MFPMIGAIWNVRGLNKRGKLQCVTDFVTDHKLDFLGFQETKKDNFDASSLCHIHKDFVWHFLPSIGTAGGILVGLNSKKFEVLAWRNTVYCVSVMIRNVVDKFVWRFVCVYGSPYEEGKDAFIQEIHDIMDNWSGPTLVGGDFNLVSSSKEKSNSLVNQKWVDLFKDWTNHHGLAELKSSTRSFTWTNNQEQPIMAAIDKFFCNSSLEQMYPLAFVTSKSRAGSDHVPLILNFGCAEVKKPSMFCFEKWWLGHPDFRALVCKIWETECIFTEPIEIWQFKIRLLRKKIKGWARNVNVELRKLKQDLLEEYDLLDKKYELGTLPPGQKDRMDTILADLERIWNMEEIKAKQRSKIGILEKEIGILLTSRQLRTREIERKGLLVLRQVMG